jgi:hypothetical protein
VASMTLNMLHQAYAGPFASKRMARDARVSHRTAEKWWAALTTPRADVLMRMARENETLRAEMLRVLQGSAYAGIADVAGAVLPPQSEGVARPGGADQEPARAVARGRR